MWQQPTRIPLDAAGQERVLSCLRLAYHLAGRCARRTGVSLEDAQDKAIDALLHAAPRYDPARGTFINLAFTSIRRRLEQLARQAGARPRMRHFSDLDGEEDHRFDPGAKPANPDNLLDGQLLWHVARAVLEPRLYQVLRLYFAEGLRLFEVGERLDLSGERVRQLIAIALKRVRKALPEMAQKGTRQIEQTAAG